MTKRFRVRVTFISVLLFAGLAAEAPAFFQKTKLEGTLGTDTAGVWLAVHHVLPTFRVRLDRDPKTVVPFKVGPIPKELAPAFGEKPEGVAIKEFTDPGASSTYGIFEGDVITRVNAIDVNNEADFKKAVDESKEWFLLTIRRPQLKFSTARLMKIDYKAAEKEVEGTSQLEEKLDVKVADVTLPFAQQLEEKRRAAAFFQPTKEQLSALRESWYKLEAPQKPPFVNGEHRVVSASTYDETLRQDENLRGTLFALISTLQGNPLGGGGGGRSIAIYGFEKVGADLASGTYVESTLATAPFPISIEFSGRFELIKLAPYSDKDVEFRTAQANLEGKKKQEEETRNVELAPDVPKDIPAAPKEQPAVAD